MSWHKEFSSYIEGRGMNEYKAKHTEKHVFEFNGSLNRSKYLKEYNGCERTRN